MTPQEALSEKNALFAPLRGFTRFALLALMVLQLVMVFSLAAFTKGKEFANDTIDYQVYLDHPHILINNEEQLKLYGAKYSSPFVPYSIYVPYKLITLPGLIPEGYELFIGLRLTMLLWFNIGLYFVCKVVQAVWDVGQQPGDRLWTLLTIFLPLNFIAPAAMSQDDTICFFWISAAMYSWSRWGVGALIGVLSVGVWFAKPFILIAFPAIWMAYPKWRYKIIGMFCVVAASLFGFYYWRDGFLLLLRPSENGSNSTTLYTLIWLIQHPENHQHWYDTAWLTKPLFLVTMGAWCLSSYYRPYQLPAAITGCYTVFFLSVPLLMPEYDLWFLPWAIWIMWQAIRQQQWLLFAMLWLHSTVGYAFKFFYACDSVHFAKFRRSPLEQFYDAHFGYDMRWLFIALLVIQIACRLGIVAYLWRYRREELLVSTPAEPVA